MENADEFSGPHELGNLLCSALGDHPFRDSFEFSGRSLRRLINLAFYASMAPEEGRFPRFALAIRSHEHAWVRARLDESLGSVNALRRLAPTCQGERDALWITEKDNELRCSGLLNLDPQVRLPSQAGTLSQSSGLTILIRVLGPGHLLVTGITTAELRAGCLGRRMPVFLLPPVNAFFEKLADRISDDIRKSAPHLGVADGLDLPPYKIHGFLAVELCNVLHSILRQGHGGCVAIIPRDSELSNHVKFRFEVEDLERPSLVAAVEDHVKATNAKARGMKAFPEYTQQLPWMKVEAVVHTLARGANVDGCIVLDAENLSLVGFGGKITVDDGDPVLAQASLVEGTAPRRCITDVLTQMGGNRHQSALRLCAKIPNAMVFVISQDGDVTLFRNDGRDVHRYGDLTVQVGEG